jgi:predicted MPP superfamily phosphohydrolase
MRPKRRYHPWYFAWRPLSVDDEETFDLLVGRLWLLTAAGAVAAFGASLLAVPQSYRSRMIGRTAGALAATGLAGLLAGVHGTVFPALTRIKLPVPHLPLPLDGLRIVHLSDFHLGMPLSVAAVRRALRMTRALRPDLIVLTGDFISYRYHLPLLRSTLAGLDAPLGMFAVLGNHDHKTEPAAIAHDLELLGITLLDNEHRVVQYKDAQMVIAGVDDMWHGRPDLCAALMDVPKDLPVLLLAHSPDYADIAAKTNVAVHFAGHTHAGHIRLPVLGSLFLPRHGVRYPHGVQRVGNMWLVISNGLGGLPLRIGARAEALLVTLQRA